MAGRPRKPAAPRNGPPADDAQKAIPPKAWGSNPGGLPRYVVANLQRVYDLLDKETRKRIGLMMEIPVFIKDPSVALAEPFLGVQKIGVRLEPGFTGGPASARVAVMDLDGDTRKLTGPVGWDPETGWFRTPEPEREWLPDAPKEPPDRELTAEDKARYEPAYRQFIEKAIANLHFHQLNAWVVVQRVLEFYEDPRALGRPVPWGFDGNRLMIVPHAGYRENAFYDRRSKSLRLYYFGDPANPAYTCLSHDIVAHETGHAVLDGIRPLYHEASSVQTSAFHEFVGDLTALLLALFNQDIRHQLRGITTGNLEDVSLVADIARQFGELVEGRPYLRSAANQLTMQDLAKSLSPHKVSQVLTGAMFDILVGMARKQMLKNTGAQAVPDDGDDDGDAAPDDAAAGDPAVDAAGGAAQAQRTVTPAQALWWAADNFRRVALQPLDLCPPCDIQFIDYARAILRNDILSNPVDEQGYRQIMLDVFHRRGLCTCDYQSGHDLPPGCAFLEVMSEVQDEQKLRLTRPNVDRIARSRTAAYYFLNDNRRQLRIPDQQDIVVVDLYENSKLGAARERLPREIVLEYLWEEKVLLDGPEFGSQEGKPIALKCGGTLVFDERGNLLSWFHKPGVEHVTPTAVQALQDRDEFVRTHSNEEAKAKRIKPLTQLERAALADLEEGKQRRAALLHYTAAAMQLGLLGEPPAGDPLLNTQRPIIALEEDGVLHLQIAPHLRDADFDQAVEGVSQGG